MRARHPGAFSTEAGFDPVTIVCGWGGLRWTKAVGAVLLPHLLVPGDDEA